MDCWECSEGVCCEWEERVWCKDGEGVWWDWVRMGEARMWDGGVG